MHSLVDRRRFGAESRASDSALAARARAMSARERKARAGVRGMVARRSGADRSSRALQRRRSLSVRRPSARCKAPPFASRMFYVAMNDTQSTLLSPVPVTRARTKKLWRIHEVPTHTRATILLCTRDSRADLRAARAAQRSLCALLAPASSAPRIRSRRAVALRSGADSPSPASASIS